MAETAVKIPVKKQEMLPSAETSQTVVGRLALRFGIAPQKLMGTLRDTLFIPPKGEQPFSESEMAAALIIAEKYELDPFTKEIHVTRSNGRLLVITGIDGWVRVVNREPLYDGLKTAMSFKEDGSPFACTCWMWIKGRSRPTEITEYFEECYRPSDRANAPWNTHPRRMLRHKAVIQCARIAFGIAGLVDDDEAARIMEAHVIDSRDSGQKLEAPKAQRYLTDAVRVPDKMARSPEVQEVVEDAILPEDVPVVDNREEPAREPGEERSAGEEPGGNPLQPTQEELWHHWKEDLQQRIKDGATLAKIKKAAGVEWLNQRTPREELALLVAEAEKVLGGGA